MLSVPNEINRLINLLSQAYVSSLNHSPVDMVDRLPSNVHTTLPISCLVWNVQGAGSRAFLSALKEIALVETHMRGEQAEKIAMMVGFNGHTRVDAVGFSDDIWIYWRKEEVTIEPIFKHDQYIIMTVTRVGATPGTSQPYMLAQTHQKGRNYGVNLRLLQQR